MSETPLKISIVSDVSCPWCIIGYKALQGAIDSLGAQQRTELSWLPFELNPQMPKEGQDTREHLFEKYGASAEQSEKNRAMMTARGKEVGFDFNFRDGGRIYNTFDAHRLIHWAGIKGLQTELKLAFFDLYFTAGGNPSSKSDLLDVAVQVGLDREGAEEIIDSDQYAKEVRDEQAYAHNLGIHSVPTFIINDKYMVSGGQPETVFKEILEKIDRQSA